jgi:hypothetical protein
VRLGSVALELHTQTSQRNEEQRSLEQGALARQGSVSRRSGVREIAVALDHGVKIRTVWSTKKRHSRCLPSGVSSVTGASF